jgi:propanol-preferring alcohol dehydrogenase
MTSSPDANCWAMELPTHGRALVRVVRQVPTPADGEVLLRVLACGVCRTDLHVVDADLPPLARPIVPGHEIVGVVEAVGPGANALAVGQRIGVPWLGGTCGACTYCRSGRENLCDRPAFTGYTRDGGYATHVVADARYCFPLPETADPVQQAPLLCAGLIGWRALRAAGNPAAVGLYGFGAAAHLVAQVAVAEGRRVFAFTRDGDVDAQRHAIALGAFWAGASSDAPPEPLDAAVIFAPVGSLVVTALGAVRKGGRVVCAGIHMSDVPSFPYRLLWEERSIVSVANLTRRDGDDFFAFVARHPLAVTTRPYPLDDANRALDDLRDGRVVGAAVLVP